MGQKLGYLKPSLAPTNRATNREILWAAGFFEGDGHVHNNGSENAGVSQKDRWVLEFMRDYFGGQIYSMGNRDAWQWCISGASSRLSSDHIRPDVPKAAKADCPRDGLELTSQYISSIMGSK